MAKFKHTSHAVYEIQYHLVWSTKYRKKVFTDTLAKYVKKLFNQIAAHYDWEIIEAGVDHDHVHILVSAPPRWAPFDIVKKIKTWSAKEMFIRFPDLRRSFWGGEFWKDGYMIKTVGNKADIDQVKKYIKLQDQVVEL
jgi:putative transposase